MLVAALFHDLGRMRQLHTGVYDQIGHGVIAWDLIKTHVSLLSYKQSIRNIKRIMRYIKTHMHHWDKDKEAPIPETIDEHIFAVADYCASRNDIDTPFIRRVPK
jgi:HD superfamily phosphodiesterase